MSGALALTGQDLLDIHRALGAAHLLDPALAIQNAVAWLCPYIVTDDDPWHYWDETIEGEVLCALMTCRKLFPDVYEKARKAIAASGKVEPAYDILLRGINSHLPYNELWELNQMNYGIPLYAFGVDLTELENDYAEGPQLLEDLGISENTHYDYDVMRRKDKAQQIIQSSLLGSDPPLPDADHELTPRAAVGWLIAWMFGNTGCDLADISNEALAECGCEDNPWTAESLRLINEAEREAACIYEAAGTGQRVLEERPEWRQALVDNWKRIEELLSHGRTPTRRACRWPGNPRHVRRGAAAADA